MAHVYYHCGGVGEEIGVSEPTIKKYSRLNYAVAFNSEGLSEEDTEKINKEIHKARWKLYCKIASITGDPIHYTPVSQHHDY